VRKITNASPARNRDRHCLCRPIDAITIPIVPKNPFRCPPPAETPRWTLLNPGKPRPPATWPDPGNRTTQFCQPESARIP
jgi:hypothetical protein